MTDSPNENEEPGIPPLQRHDAPDPDRPYVVWSPVLSAASAAVTLSLIAIWITANAFAVIAAFAAFVLGVSSCPEMLRAPVLTRLDTRGKKWAKRKRVRRKRRHQRIEKVLLKSVFVPAALLVLGGVVLVAAPVLALFGGDWQRALLGGVGALLLAFLVALAIQVGAIMFAQLKGDIPTGPMVFYKAASLADSIDANPGLRRNVQLWSAGTAFVFGLVALVVH
jgi:hypothetical protein